jgi:hypothetical protein
MKGEKSGACARDITIDLYAAVPGRFAYRLSLAIFDAGGNIGVRYQHIAAPIV